jgi:hypothetical protein
MKARINGQRLEGERKRTIAEDATDGIGSEVGVVSMHLGLDDSLTISMTMNDYNDDEHRPVLSGSSQSQNQQQSETTPNTLSLTGLDIPSSDLGLDSIIAPSEQKPEWAGLDSQFSKHESG